MLGDSGSDSTFQHPLRDYNPRLPAHRVALLDGRVGTPRDADVRWLTRESITLIGSESPGLGRVTLNLHN